MFPNTTRVLVVDDMPIMRATIKSQLRTIGFQKVLEAENGVKALELIKINAATDPVQLILSDWNMPEMNGIEFLEKIRKSPDTSKLPFIMITAEGEVSQVKLAVSLGVNNFVMKPFTPATLQEKMNSVWEKIQAAGVK